MFWSYFAYIIDISHLMWILLGLQCDFCILKNTIFLVISHLFIIFKRPFISWYAINCPQSIFVRCWHGCCEQRSTTKMNLGGMMQIYRWIPIVRRSFFSERFFERVRVLNFLLLLHQQECCYNQKKWYRYLTATWGKKSSKFTETEMTSHILYSYLAS